MFMSIDSIIFLKIHFPKGSVIYPRGFNGVPLDVVNFYKYEIYMVLKQGSVLK